MIKKIALIGAGQLGSRHLQGLAKSDLEIDIEVLEPFENSIKLAKSRFEEMPKNKNIIGIKYIENFSEISDVLDLAIVATNSDVRFDIVEKLLTSKKVKNLVLEKVLFQKIEDYKKIDELLRSTNTRCWVNHPRRMFPLYRRLKYELQNSKFVNFLVSGGNWGLACNGLHFLDCFSYLTNEIDLRLSGIYLEDRLYDTKRKGFNEIGGMISGALGNRATFSINCFPENYSPVQFCIVSDNINVLIDEANNWYRISDNKNNWIPEDKTEKIVYFQSELTNILINDIFNDTCGLPTYDEAMMLHVQYLTFILEHINSFSDIKYDFCPIT